MFVPFSVETASAVSTAYSSNGLGLGSKPSVVILAPPEATLILLALSGSAVRLSETRIFTREASGAGFEGAGAKCQAGIAAIARTRCGARSRGGASVTQARGAVTAGGVSRVSTAARPPHVGRIR